MDNFPSDREERFVPFGREISATPDSAAEELQTAHPEGRASQSRHLRLHADSASAESVFNEIGMLAASTLPIGHPFIPSGSVYIYTDGDQRRGCEAEESLVSILPRKGLKRVRASDTGNTYKDYGQSQAQLNFLGKKEKKNIGVLNIGLTYESDQKLKHFGTPLRPYCQESLKYLKYLEQVKTAFSARFGSYVKGEALSTLRVSFICGARTRLHTDAFGGPTDNYFLPHGVGCQLRVHRFPAFRSSVVLYRGKPFIPLAYGGAKDELHMIGGSPSCSTQAAKYEFKGFNGNFTELRPFGNLDVVVIGVKSGKLQVCPYLSEVDWGKTIAGPHELPLITLEQALERAEAHKSSVRLEPVILGKAHTWSSFTGWRYAHEYVGSEPMCERTHVFFRVVRQRLPSRNFVRRRKRNFVTVRREQSSI
jgi:hypothetical protein